MCSDASTVPRGDKPVQVRSSTAQSAGPEASAPPETENILWSTHGHMEANEATILRWSLEVPWRCGSIIEPSGHSDKRTSVKPPQAASVCGARARIGPLTLTLARLRRLRSSNDSLYGWYLHAHARCGARRPVLMRRTDGQSIA